MGRTAESTFKGTIWLNFYSFWAFIDLVADNLAAPAYDYLKRIFTEFCVKKFGVFEVLLYEYFGVVIGAFTTFFTIAVHVIPA